MNKEELYALLKKEAKLEEKLRGILSRNTQLRPLHTKEAIQELESLTQVSMILETELEDMRTQKARFAFVAPKLLRKAIMDDFNELNSKDEFYDILSTYIHDYAMGTTTMDLQEFYEKLQSKEDLEYKRSNLSLQFYAIKATGDGDLDEIISQIEACDQELNEIQEIEQTLKELISNETTNIQSPILDEIKLEYKKILIKIYNREKHLLQTQEIVDTIDKMMNDFEITLQQFKKDKKDVDKETYNQAIQDLSSNLADWMQLAFQDPRLEDFLIKLGAFTILEMADIKKINRDFNQVKPLIEYHIDLDKENLKQLKKEEHLTIQKVLHYIIHHK